MKRVSKTMRLSLPVLLSAALLVIALVPGCGRGPAAGSSSAPPPAVPSEPLLPPPGETRLRDYIRWSEERVPDDMAVVVELDRAVFSRPMGDGRATEAISHPRRWPTELLDRYVPEYIGEGWLYELFVTHAAVSTAAEDISGVTVTVYSYLQDEIDAYVEELRGAGLEDMEENAAAVIRRSIPADEVLCLIHTDFQYVLIFGHDDLGEYVQFSLTRFKVREPVLPKPDPDALLIGYHKWAEDNGVEVDGESRPDELAGERVDEYGRYYATVYAPSHWPFEVFGNLIPAFTESAVLHSTEITYPEDKREVSDLLIASVYISAFDDVVVSRYLQALKDWGFRELDKSEYSEQELEMAEKNHRQHILYWPGFKCFVSVFSNGGDNRLLHIALRCDARYESFFSAAE